MAVALTAKRRRRKWRIAAALFALSRESTSGDRLHFIGRRRLLFALLQAPSDRARAAHCHFNRAQAADVINRLLALAAAAAVHVQNEALLYDDCRPTRGEKIYFYDKNAAVQQENFFLAN